MRIFLSYRRADPWAASVVPRLHERLVARYGRENLFLDLESVPPGRDFRAVINSEVEKADLLLAVIGKTWSRMTRNRALDAVDYMRVEIECAFRQKLPVIPVLVGHATKPPREAELPPSIKQFAFCHSVTLDPGRDFDTHLARLVNDIERYYGAEKGEVSDSAPPDDKTTETREKFKEARSHEERKEFHEAARLYREAAIAAVTDQDDPLGYLRGQEIKRPKALHGFSGEYAEFREEIKTRAESGDAEAQFAMAEYYRDLLMSWHDWGDNLKAYEKPAAQQFVPAMFRLAEEYEFGYCQGNELISGDYEMAAHWYRAVAETLLGQ